MKNKNQAEMSFLEHLEELRWHLVRSFLYIFVFAVLAFIFKNIVFDVILLGPSKPDFFTNRLLCGLAEDLSMPVLCINQEPLSLQNINMTGQFTTHLWVSFLAGVIVAFPLIFWEFWRFIKPALYKEEVESSRGAIFFASILFTIGILFAYYIISPLSVHFLGNYQVSEQVDNIVNLGSYIGTVSSIILASGILFELPMFIYFMSKVGLVTADTLKKYRRHSIVVTLALAAIITPPDVISQILVCLPLILLYEAGIIIARGVEYRRSKELAKQ
ncbi:MAG: tatC [Anaerophaga sp.]|uniref:twin-arginine translocase subunit TatC n=1 Tax=Anaerophaga thermohalophila TaxID=177400 RepID=UPI000237C25E|nr:twin-arginine translocase subunit TatC [Anaerophaga thermohalophila]MBZ4675584.1 tatC [Anaerophaga sp.]MDI3520083.1 sec-independent protein translocase protein TatC [Anaerophaga sp.]MDK2841969.1 sec-independent protein translocase protein TatC [Anaerophaga sp.]MDN5290140.1 sec-independent protein translocase protein TatC [Anaerophaga sp.]